MPPITLIIGPQKPVFCSENLPGLPGSRDDADELVDGPDRLLGVSALGGRRPFLGGEIMESRRQWCVASNRWGPSRRMISAFKPKPTYAIGLLEWEDEQRRRKEVSGAGSAWSAPRPAVAQ